jgi:phosphoglucomutase
MVPGYAYEPDVSKPEHSTVCPRENICKLYAETFISQSHLDAIVEEAQEIARRALTKGQ